MNKPLVSVCLITYNHEKYIKQALDSILMQKINFAWEIIIADDCSPDGTMNIVKQYQQKYPELIKILHREKNVGPSLNFVELIGAATGKYIAYLEGDDYWTDELKLQKQFDYMLLKPHFSICYHRINWEFMYKSDEWAKLREPNLNDPSESSIYDLLNRGWFIRSCSMFFRNFKLPAGFEKLYIGDFPLHILLADLGKIGFINECMATYRIHKHGLSETMLFTNDLNKKIKNHKQEIFLFNYLNEHTNYKYNKYFKKKLFDEIFSFNKGLFHRNKYSFLKNLFITVLNFNIIFLIKQSFYKIAKKKNIYPLK